MRKVSGRGKAQPFRPFGPPLPFWRSRATSPVSGESVLLGEARERGLRPALRLSKNSLAPSGRGLRPQAVGERASRRHEGFGKRRGSLPPALRATSLPEGGFLTRRERGLCPALSWPPLGGGCRRSGWGREPRRSSTLLLRPAVAAAHGLIPALDAPGALGFGQGGHKFAVHRPVF